MADVTDDHRLVSKGRSEAKGEGDARVDQILEGALDPVFTSVVADVKVHAGPEVEVHAFGEDAEPRSDPTLSRRPARRSSVGEPASMR